LSKGGHAITMDELNGFLNLWNKSCVPTPIFEIYCQRSKHIIALRKSAYASFGKTTNKNSNRAFTGQENSVKKLFDFFLDANIFQGKSSDAREMTKDFSGQESENQIKQAQHELGAKSNVPLR